jgi:UDP-glucose 4-epimerase
MTTSLVTGGAGFIGSHLVRALLARGDRVRVLDNFSTGRRENLAGLAENLEVIEGDLREARQVQAAVQGVDFVFHQAAFVSVRQSMREPQECFAVNVGGTLNLLEAARQAGVERVVMASSAAVYGDSPDLPLKEDAGLRPLSPYAASKLTTEIYAGMYTRSFNLPVAALRYFNVYGPRQNPKSDYAAVIPIFIDRLLSSQAPVVFGDGTQKRDFIFIEDVVRANLIASQTPAVDGQALNICRGMETDLLELLATLGLLFPQAPAARLDPPVPGDIYRSLGDPEKARRLMGFTAQVSLADGLAQTVEWMRW